ncbi:MAG: right-handed parallel beta-helix repeat-containing protein, partial [Planctomycetota bacterium]
MKWLDGYRMRLMFASFIMAIVLGGIELANGATINVRPVGGYDLSVIQMGIDVAVDGDVVLVAPGEYVITEPITFRGKAITVMSETGPDETTIRMGTSADTNRGSVVIFENNETAASVLDGFTITGGKGSLSGRPGEENAGGGIYFDSSSGTVTNCVIVQNTARHGGGVSCVHPCSPILIDCTIAENIAQSGSGGGVLVDRGASASLSNCIIRDNSAIGDSTSSGGGVLCYLNSSLAMTDCIIAQNSAGNTGGGVFYGMNSSVTMTYCAIVDNTGTEWCGGVAGWQGGTATISNCTIWGNFGGEWGGGLGCYKGASATVTNSILWGNTAATGIGDEIYLERYPTVFSITYSNVAGGQAGVGVDGGTLNWGEGNIDADPLFADAASGDYHLKSQAGRWDPNSESWVQDDVTSPCIDAGDPMSPIGLEPFANGGFVNMGAYGCMPEASKSYFGEPICGAIFAGDINGDCQVDRADLAIM